MSTVVLLVTLLAAAAPQQPADATALTFSSPRLLAEVDSGKLRGDPSRLSWGAAEGQLYLRVAELDRWNNERPKHYLLPLSGGPAVATDGEPPDASAYWAWKSGVAAPGLPSLRFEIEARQENKTATGTDRGSTDLGVSPNRSDPTSSSIAADIASMQRVQTSVVRLKGHLVLEAVNEPLRPGRTFSWAPAPLAALAFVDGRRRLAVIDSSGRKAEVPGTSDAILPAWSPDGKQIVYLQKKDRKKYAVMTVEVK